MVTAENSILIAGGGIGGLAAALAAAGPGQSDAGDLQPDADPAAGRFPCGE